MSGSEYVWNRIKHTAQILQISNKYPIKGNDVEQFIKNTITRPNIIVGDYSYYDA